MSGAGPVEFWFDFSSGYAYFAAQEVEALGARVGRPILWRPFMLGTAFKVTGARGLSATPLKQDYARLDWQRLARRAGLVFAPPADHPRIALPATRAFYWIEGQDPPLAVRFAQGVFAAYYAGQLDTADLDQVSALAATLGLDRQAVAAGAVTPAVKARARDLGDQAVARGVFGSPFFIVDGAPFWGADRLPMLEDWIRTGGW